MNRIDLEFKIKEMGSSEFQRLGDCLLEKQGHKIIHFGNCDGKNTTRKGTPDSYYVENDNKSIVFIEYTVQVEQLKGKIHTDIGKCIKKAEKFKSFKLSKILYFTSFDNIDSTILDEAQFLCRNKGIELELISLSSLCSKLYFYKSVIKEIFNCELDGDFFYSLSDFIDYSKNQKGVDYSFKFIRRENDEKIINDSLDNNFITVLYGKAGVGKSMLAIHSLINCADNVLCVRKSNENSLNDIKENIANNNMTILFLDDVNEIASFVRFMQTLTPEIASKIKIICTVREYALNSLKKVFVKYDYQIGFVEIKKTSNELIEEILKTNLGIKNPAYLKKIVGISKGNARLAIMAGKVAKENGVSVFNDTKSVLKKYFEIANNDKTKELIEENIGVLAIISFLKRVNIEKLSEHKNLFKLFKVTEDKFLESIEALRDNEIISIYEDCVVEIDDQNMSDFIIEDILFERKICSISDLVILTFETNKISLVNSLNILTCVYTSEETNSYVTSEIKKAWNKLEETENIESFIYMFYEADINRALAFFNVKISKGLKLYAGEPEKFEKNYSNCPMVNVLTSICKNHMNDDALKILYLCLDYEKVRDNAFEALIELSNLTPEMFSGNKVNNKVIFEIEKYKTKNWFEFLLLSLLKQGLKFEFESRALSSRNTISIRRLDLHDSFNGILEYRNNLWELAYSLSDKRKYDLIYSFKDTFINKDCVQILNNDLINISRLLKSIVDIDTLGEQLFKLDMLDKINFVKAESSKLKLHSEKLMSKLIFIIDPKDRRLSFDERKNKFQRKVCEFAKNNNTKTIGEYIQVCDLISRRTPNVSWKINNFLNLLLGSLEKETLLKLLDKRLLGKFSYEIKRMILDFNYRIGNGNKVLAILKENQTNEETINMYFSIFDNITNDDISQKTKDLFDTIFSLDLKMNNNCSRRIDTLYKFCSNDKDFADKLCLIHNIKEIRRNKFNSWIQFLFNEYCFEPNKLVKIFKENNLIDVLEDFILYEASYKSNAYDLNLYVYPIIKFDNNFLITITNKLCDFKIRISEDILNGLWEQEEAEKYANIIFDRFVTINEFEFLHPLAIEHVFIGGTFRNNNDEAFLIWANKKINSIDDAHSIKLLTDFVSKCDGENAFNYYVALTKKQIDINLFDDLLRLPSSYSWSGSQTVVVNSRINKFKNVLDRIPKGLEFINYRVCLEKYLDALKESIKAIRITEKMDFDFIG